MTATRFRLIWILALLAVAPACSGDGKDLIHAAWLGDAAEVNSLLSRRADPNASDRTGLTPLMAAVWNASGTPNLDIARALLARKADPNIATMSGQTALMEVAELGNAEFVRVLLEAGADPNARMTGGHTALMGAAKNGHTQIVRMLLEKGADPNPVDDFGSSALVLATMMQLRAIPPSRYRPPV